MTASLLRSLKMRGLSFLLQLLLPWSGPAASRLKTLLLRASGVTIGSGGSIGRFVDIRPADRIVLGDGVNLSDYVAIYAFDGSVEIDSHVSLARNCTINASDSGTIRIGSECLIGPNVVLRASDHVFVDISRSIRSQGHNGGTIILEKDVWIGANAVITKDVRIGEKSIIGAGSVVTHDIEPMSVAFGAPASTHHKRT